MNGSQRFIVEEKMARAWRGLKVAILVREGRINRFMENTAVNRGASILVAYDPDKALKWIMNSPADAQSAAE